jgi:16S rRNA G966 N2-methylase RsmD
MDKFLDFLKKKEVKKFILDNRNSSPQKLILNPPREYKNQIKQIVNQIIARQKAKGKLNDWAENDDLILPPPLSIEQASSGSTSKYKKQLLKGDHLIDLTGGMGIDCLAISEHFDTVTYVEKSRQLCAVFKHNCEVLGRDIEVRNALAEDFLKQEIQLTSQNNLSKKVLYIDPARRDDAKNKVFQLEDCTPNMKELMPLMKKVSSQALVKLSPLVDLKSILSEFEFVKELHVVSVKNDCKEILVLIDFSYTGEAGIKAINLETEQPPYSFKFSEEEKTNNQYGLYDSYVFEPNSSILKAGAFKLMGQEFSLKKLHQHTHLYTSNTHSGNFPGRIFRILEPANKTTIGQYARGGKMNVLTRNYPLKPDALKKNWKLKDGGDYFLLGFKNINEQSELVIAERVF